MIQVSGGKRQYGMQSGEGGSPRRNARRFWENDTCSAIDERIAKLALPELVALAKEILDEIETRTMEQA